MDLIKINYFQVEPKYYADGEDAYAMKRDLMPQHSTSVTSTSTTTNTEPLVDKMAALLTK